MAQHLLSTLRTYMEGFESGIKLPGERELAEQLGTSRRSLRNAFAVLEAEGAIWRGVGQGTFVGRKPIEAESDLLELKRKTSPVEVMDARIALEPKVVRLAALHATQSDLEQLEAIHAKSCRQTNYEAFALWDERFHKQIVEASHHHLFITLMTAVMHLRHQLPWGQLHRKVQATEWLRAASSQHTELLKALKDRNPERSEWLMTEHLRGVYRNILGRDSDL